MLVSNCTGPSGYKPYKLAAPLILGLGLGLAIAAALPIFAQSQTQLNAQQTAASAPANPDAGSANKLSFEVASVRPGQKFFLKGYDFLDPVNKAAPPPKGGLFSWNVPVGYLIFFAYDLRSIQLRREAGEQAILERIQRLRKTGKSLRKIADQLNRLEIRTRQGSPWRHEYIARLLKAA